MCIWRNKISGGCDEYSARYLDDNIEDTCVVWQHNPWISVEVSTM